MLSFDTVGIQLIQVAATLQQDRDDYRALGLGNRLPEGADAEGLSWCYYSIFLLIVIVIFIFIITILIFIVSTIVIIIRV